MVVFFLLAVDKQIHPQGKYTVSLVVLSGGGGEKPILGSGLTRFRWKSSLDYKTPLIIASISRFSGKSLRAMASTTTMGSNRPD